jgi:hypothetical protein
MNNKLGQTGNMTAFITAIVIVGVTLVIGLFIAAQIGTSLQDTVTGSGTDTNKTLTAMNETPQNFLIVATHPSAVCVVTVVHNASNGVVISSANYTLPTSCSMNSTATSPSKDYNWNVTYTYTWSELQNSAASNASDELVDALGSGTAWITILVVAGFAVIVLGMLTQGLGAEAAEQEGQPVY